MIQRADSRPAVLVLDTNPESFSKIHDALTDAGVCILATNSLDMAPALAGCRTPDLILINGEQPFCRLADTCRNVKQVVDTYGTPVVALAGCGGKNEPWVCSQICVLDYIPDPHDTDELLRCIRRYIDLGRLSNNQRKVSDLIASTHKLIEEKTRHNDDHTDD